jgi:hypothetical protein
MVIALGQQDVRRRTGRNPIDGLQDPVGLCDLHSSSAFNLKRQISGGHVVLIQQ